MESLRHLNRRTFVGGSLAVASMPLFAQGDAPYPNRPIRLIVVFPAGGGTDVAARIVGPKLSDKFGQPVIIENRPGMGGGIGIELVAKSPPDGYTLVLASSGGLTALPYLYKSLPFNPQKDLEPISTFCVSPLVLVAGPSFQGKNVKDLISLAKQQPGKIAFGSGGNGTAPHLAGELFMSMTKTDLLHVPYKGSGPAVVAAIAGDIPLVFGDMGTVRPHLASGRLRALGVLGKTRTPIAPEIPTVAQAGVPGYEVEGWFAVLAPAGTPASVIDKLNPALGSIIGSADVKARLATAALEPSFSTPGELRRKMVKDSEKWSKLIRENHISAD
ncbi:MAG TPA: tripartite tricarboxylate transporter substrate binding protein [Ramlibacter sp.]|nr:tripartite tricarboxylate transporter substrate binding protein [Ramlibacter sp.]